VGTKNTKQLTSIEQLPSENNNNKTSTHDKHFCVKKLGVVKKKNYTANRTSMN
jgi:hypothetical protein